MRRFIIVAITSLGLVGFAATGPAKAQAFRPTLPGSGNPYGSPPLSPYLNLLRPGSSAAVNYYGLVRPQQAYNTAINSLEQQVVAGRVATTAAENLAAPSTGHPIYFLSGYQRFFLNTGAVAPFQNLQATAGGGGSSSHAGARFSAGAISNATTPNFRR